jgi:hypothetical protein
MDELVCGSFGCCKRGGLGSFPLRGGLALQLRHTLLPSTEARLEVAVVLHAAVGAAIGELGFKAVIAEEAELVAARAEGGVVQQIHGGDTRG